MFALSIYSWLRVSDSGATYPIPPSQRIFPSQSILFIKHIDDRDAGRWVRKKIIQLLRPI